ESAEDPADREGDERSRRALVFVAVGLRTRSHVTADEPQTARELARDVRVRVRRAAARVIVARNPRRADRRAEDRSRVIAGAGAGREVQRLVIPERPPSLRQLSGDFREAERRSAANLGIAILETRVEEKLVAA